MRVIWTDQAEETHQEIIDYIQSKFTTKEVIDFIDLTDSVIENICNNIEIGLPYKKTIYRQFLVSKQTYLFYKIENETIYLSVFWNNVKNPIDLNNILRS